MSAEMTVAAGDLFKLRGSTQQAPHILVVSVDEAGAQVIPVVAVPVEDAPSGWARTHGRMQTIALKGFTPANVELVQSGIFL